MRLPHPTLPRHLLQDFIWRDQLEGVLDHLAAHNIVILSGMGGEGKTRLAVQTAFFIADPKQLTAVKPPTFPDKFQTIAAELHDKFAQVAFVDMAQCDPNEQDELAFWSVLSKSVRGVTEGTTADRARADFIHYLESEKHSTLLVLDNGEQVNADLMAKALSELARAASALVTCRYPIANVQGGVNISIAAMPLLKPGTDFFVNLQDAEAVRLFARRVGLDLYPPQENLTNEEQEEHRKELDAFVSGLLESEQNVRKIADICNLCECIPLAIVLAASRAAELSEVPLSQSDGLRRKPSEEWQAQWLAGAGKTLERIYGQLHMMYAAKSLGALERRSEKDTRFATLDACIKWSYELLGFSGDRETQQSLFRALSVFAGEWTLNEMQTVCQTIGSGQALMEAHKALQDTHLVVPSRSGNSEAFTFLQPIREVATNLFEANNPTDSEVPQRHCRLFLDRLQADLTSYTRLMADLTSHTETLPYLDTHKNDIEAALRFAFRSQQEEFRKVADWMEQALASPHSGYSLACLPFARVLLDILEANGVEEWRLLPSPDNGNTGTGFQLSEAGKTCSLPANLFYLHRGREISRVANNESPLTALFGVSNPDYAKLHDIEEPEVWLRETEATIFVLAESLRRETTADKRTMIYRLLACIFFITYDWWDAYLKNEDATAGRVLEQWGNHAAKNKGLVFDLLKEFDANYPQKSERRGREQKKTQWRKALQALQGLQSELKLLPPYSYNADNFRTRAQAGPPEVQMVQSRNESADNHASQSSRFLIGILERFSGEASFCIRQENKAKSADARPQQEWETHYRNSIEALSQKEALPQNQDSFLRFYWQWSLGDQGQRYLETGDAQGFAICREALRDEYREFEEYGFKTDRLDLELLANSYAALGGGYARADKPASAAWCYTGAILLALAFMLIECDEYGRRFYQEHHSERMDKTALFAPNLWTRVQERVSGRFPQNQQEREKATDAWTYFWQIGTNSSTQSRAAVATMPPTPPSSEDELNKPETLTEIAAAVRAVALRFSTTTMQENWWPSRPAEGMEELTNLRALTSHFDAATMDSLLGAALEETA